MDPGRWSYVAVLCFVLIGCLWLEVALRTRVLIRTRRLFASLVVPILAFYAWDAYAVSSGHWTFDPDRILGITLPGGVPLDELLFFMVIPLAAILTLEAVRSVRGWKAGDEA